VNKNDWTLQSLIADTKRNVERKKNRMEMAAEVENLL
jgi:hypothetical protein